MDDVNGTKKGYRIITLKKMIAAAALLTLCGAGVAAAGEQGMDNGFPEALKGLKIEALGYIEYASGEIGGAPGSKTNFNNFNLTRGYLTVQKTITPWLGARVTTDITRVGSPDKDAGDWDTRIKYLYAELRPHDLGQLTGMKSELGQGHIAWLDFEEHVNPYRCQGTMAIERAGVFNSADVGVSIRGDFGGKLADAKKVTGNSHYNGRYGTWHVGVYNGGGYHAAENNDNKVVQGRLTVRPLPDTVPGLQFSYLGIFGKGNVSASPDYMVNLGMISYEHPNLILTGQYFATQGNSSGAWVVPMTNRSLDTAAYSFFGNYRLPVLERKLSVFGRYDHFDADDDNDMAIAGEDADYELFMGGLAYNLYKGNQVLLTYETTSYGKDSGGKGKVPSSGLNLGDDKKFQVVYQLSF